MTFLFTWIVFLFGGNLEWGIGFFCYGGVYKLRTGGAFRCLGIYTSTNRTRYLVCGKKNMR